MTIEDLNKLAVEIIHNNLYLSLATCNDNETWIAPLFYKSNNKNQLYFASQLTSRHVQHILKNPEAAVAIFDSHQKEGEGVGIQAHCLVNTLESKPEIEEALKYYKTDYWELSPDKFMGNNTYRLFTITLTETYLNDPRVKEDRRVKVSLNL